MLGILLCDSEPNMVHEYGDTLKTAIAKDDLDADIVLSTIDENEVIDFFRCCEGLFFVLLELVNHDVWQGVEVAKFIRKTDRESYLVFVSRHFELIQKTLSGIIRPSGFLMKPVSKKELIDTFLTAYCDHVNLLNKDNCYSITIGSRYYRIQEKNICYIEAFQKKIFIHTSTQKIGYYDSLEAIGKKLDAHAFVRCHKGFIVNTSKIKEIDFSNMTIRLLDNTCIPLSRTYKDAMKKFIQ